ncbi:MAG TPA: acetyl-CoA carboxylase biotin carboxyl carrier protein [Verrucomicrobiota bacterium]|nr:acetyl-CoA carboxylase biotin carboxyl carrier protein [Verrucomicrobiota bacterium]
MDLKDIKAIIDLMKKNSIAEFELERQDFKIKLKRGAPGPVPEESIALSYPGVPASLPAASSATTRVIEPPPGTGNGIEIKSPMIGTFYRSPSPEAAAYIEVGAEVGPETVVCIIEAMKVMNEIKAEVRGIVTEICVDNARPVEFGQPLFKVRPL